jgi:hypothetical protein
MSQQKGKTPKWRIVGILEREDRKILKLKIVNAPWSAFSYDFFVNLEATRLVCCGLRRGATIYMKESDLDKK